MKPANYKTLKTIESKLSEIYENEKDSNIYTFFKVYENSTLKELRIYSELEYRLKIDEIAWPKDLTKTQESSELWIEMHTIKGQISNAAKIFYHKDKCILVADSKTKKGSAAKEAARESFKIYQGNIFIGAYKNIKKEISARLTQVKELQAKQMEVLKKMRASNSAYLSKKRAEAAEAARKNAEAFASGNFWDADRGAIKNYFHPPFGKNYLVDVSERWRAALFLECESESYKRGSGSWGHKLVGTGRGYLCGIDDNGDEWGHVVSGLDQDYDDFYSRKLENYVHEAMAILFKAPSSKMDEAARQGDLLFIPTKIRTQEIIRCKHCHEPKSRHEQRSYDDGFEIFFCPHRLEIDSYMEEILPIIELAPHEGAWEIRESHTVQSEGLLRNGRYFKSENPITVTHTSHQPVILEPGEYRLYTLDIPNAD